MVWNFTNEEVEKKDMLPKLSEEVDRIYYDMISDVDNERRKIVEGMSREAFREQIFASLLDNMVNADDDDIADLLGFDD